MFCHFSHSVNSSDEVKLLDYSTFLLLPLVPHQLANLVLFAELHTCDNVHLSYLADSDYYYQLQTNLLIIMYYKLSHTKVSPEH